MPKKSTSVVKQQASGEMGKLLSMDLAEYGEKLPQQLKIIINSIRDSATPMMVVWGQDMRVFYNEPLKLVSGLSSGLAGTPAHEIFPQAWPLLNPLFTKTLLGESVALNNFLIPLERNGFVENCFFNLSFSPIKNDEEDVEGMLGIFIETTERAQNERRLHTLHDLLRVTHEVHDAEEVCKNIVRVLTTNTLDVPFALLYLLTDDGKTAQLMSCSGIDNNDQISPACIDLTAEIQDTTWPLAQVLNSRQLELIPDLSALFKNEAENGHPITAHAAVIVSISRPAQEIPYGVLIAGINQRKNFDEDYHSFFELAADHILSAIRNVKVLEDAAEQKRLYEALCESEGLYRQIVESLPAAYYTCDAEGRITFCNEASVILWGRRPVLGKDLWCGSWKIYRTDGTLLPLDECPMGIALKEGRPVYGEEIIIERPDGVRRNVLPHPRPIFNIAGKVIGAYNMLVDITSLRDAELALRESEKQFRQELEKRVMERTLDLKKANEALEKSNQELEQFAYVASHDLQEPLRKIQTFSDRLILKSRESIDEAGKVYVDKIASSTERMSRLITDLLNYSRLSTNEDSFVKTDLNEILNNVLNDFELSIEQKKAIIETEPLPVIEAIPLQMNQLFYNLISNTLKFCKEHIPPVIRISSKQLHEKELLFYKELNKDLTYYELVFSDNGIGFDPEYTEQIFEIFRRLHGRNEYAGTGIGLAICRKIINKHNGLIYAQTEEMKGTSFHVILPVSRGNLE